MEGEGVFLLGPNGRMTRIEGERGKTPSCPNAKFVAGDVVKVRRGKHFADIPAELVVLVAIPPHFSPDWALADLVGKPRPLMVQVGARSITYILARDSDPKPYLLREAHLRPSGKDRVEIGEIRITPEGDSP